MFFISLSSPIFQALRRYPEQQRMETSEMSSLLKKYAKKVESLFIRLQPQNVKSKRENTTKYVEHTRGFLGFSSVAA